MVRALLRQLRRGRLLIEAARRRRLYARMQAGDPAAVRAFLRLSDRER